MPRILTRPHVVFSGGATGGHLFPGLAVAQRLGQQWPQLKITFAGSGRSWEHEQVSAAGWDYQAIPCRAMPQNPWQGVRFLADNMAGYLAARWLLREHQVSAVVGLGGFASAPMARAAVMAGVPTVLLEQNAVPGKVTRWLAPKANAVCAAMSEVQTQLKSTASVQVTGNPVRADFQALWQKNNELRSSRKRLLVLGGSGGARPLNDAVPRALYKLGEHMHDWQVVHQTGPGEVGRVERLYQKLGVPAVVVSFIHNLPGVLRDTSLVLCRGGGTTLAELSVAGVPAVVVPYPQAADDHQHRNAEVYASADACRLVPQELPEMRLDDRLRDELETLLGSEPCRFRMAQAMRGMARPDAADEVAGVIADAIWPQAHRRAA